MLHVYLPLGFERNFCLLLYAGDAFGVLDSGLLLTSELVLGPISGYDQEMKAY